MPRLLKRYCRKIYGLGSDCRETLGEFRRSEVLRFPQEIKAEPQKQNFQRFAFGETACKHSAMISIAPKLGEPQTPGASCARSIRTQFRRKSLYRMVIAFGRVFRYACVEPGEINMTKKERCQW